MLRRIEASIGMILQETEKVVAPEEIELTRLEGLACEFVRSARDGGMQAQYLTGFGDAEDQGSCRRAMWW